VEYSLRIRKAGYKLYLSSQSRICHKDSSDSITVRILPGIGFKRLNFEKFYFRAYLDLRNWIYFTKHYRSFIFKCCYFSLLLPLQLAEMTTLIIIFDDRKFLRIKRVFEAARDGIINRMGAPKFLAQ